MSGAQDFVITRNGILAKYNGPGGDVDIPEGVKKIGWIPIQCFFQEESMKIGHGAFEGRTGLRSVTIPAGVTEIGSSAFSGCTSLQNVTIPAGVTEIGSSAFSGCRGLQSITIPAGVTKIEDRTFEGCRGLQSVTIPAGVTKIEWHAFEGCTGLQSVTIPAGVTAIEIDAFSGTPWLNALGEFAAVNHILLRYQGPGGDVTIPAGVTAIGPFAFSDCTGIRSVTIPEGVTVIGNGAFSGCTGLRIVTISAGVTVIGENAFKGCTGLQGVTVPKSVKKIDKSAFEGDSPMIVAPHIPVGDFAPKNKPGACAGFAKRYLEKAELDDEIRAGYLKYIKGQKKKLYPAAIQYEELLQLMFAEKTIPRKDVQLLLDEADKQKNPAAKAAVMEYSHQSAKLADPDRGYKL